MKNLLNAVANQEIIDRINHLSSTSQAQWGKMTVDQMLAHCQVPLQVAFGEVKLKQGLIGVLLGGLVKKQLMSDKPFKKGLPTDKSFIVIDQRDFNEEKEKLSVLVNHFVSKGPVGISKNPHPIFGKMTPDEWGYLAWKHLDHHLTQFGV